MTKEGLWLLIEACYHNYDCNTVDPPYLHAQNHHNRIIIKNKALQFSFYISQIKMFKQ